MRQRRLGASGPVVSALGLGCMGMSDFYGPADEARSIDTIRAALDAGISWLDTGDFYGVGHNEMLIREAVRGRREKAFIAVKFGVLRSPDGGFVGLDVRPQAVRSALAYTLRRLGTDHVDLYQPARVDPSVPIEETVGAIADMVKAGYVRHVGLSEAGPETIRRAHAAHPVAAVQAEWSLMSRGVEAAVVPTARELGIGITAYGVLSRGLLGGRAAQGPRAAHDFRSGHAPRFAPGNLERNLELADALEALARARGRTPAQMALAWALHRGDDVVPLIGARTPERLAEALGALEIALDGAELAAIEAAVPADRVAGARYAPQQMAMLDSERLDTAARG